MVSLWYHKNILNLVISVSIVTAIGLHILMADCAVCELCVTFFFSFFLNAVE